MELDDLGLRLTTEFAAVPHGPECPARFNVCPEDTRYACDRLHCDRETRLIAGVLAFASEFYNAGAAGVYTDHRKALTAFREMAALPELEGRVEAARAALARATGEGR